MNVMKAMVHVNTSVITLLVVFTAPVILAMHYNWMVKTALVSVVTKYM